MALTYEETKNNRNSLPNKNFRSLDQTIKKEMQQLAIGGTGSLENYLKLYYSVLRRHDILETRKTKEETLNTAISLLRRDHPEFKPRINHDFSDVSESENRELLDEVRLKADILRKKKMRKATLLSVMRAGSTLMLFLAIGLLQFGFSLYLFSLAVGCVILGLSTFLERGT